MARVKIDLPSSFSFSTSIPVRITDLNYGGHVGNDTLLSIIHEARMQFLKSAGYSELQFEGAGLIMSDVSIEFKGEVFYGDIIKAFVAVRSVERVSFDVIYKFEVERDSITKTVAVAKSGMVCYDYDLKKVIAIPPAAKARLLS